MNADELKKEAEEWLCNNLHSASEEDFIKAMVDIAEPREKRIAELEKRCANYEMNISKMEKGTCDICKETEKDKKIEELEKACDETQELLDKQIEATYRLDKENAELRKDKKELCHSISEGGKACVYLNEQLTKAKDHIKTLLDCLKQDTNDPQTNYYVCQYMDKAEQFIKDSEVENV